MVWRCLCVSVSVVLLLLLLLFHLKESTLYLVLSHCGGLRLLESQTFGGGLGAPREVFNHLVHHDRGEETHGQLEGLRRILGGGAAGGCEVADGLLQEGEEQASH